MQGIKRRGALLGALAAPMVVEQVGAQSAFDWKRFRGERIEVSVQLSPRGNLLTQHNREFEELTGIRAGVEVVPEQQHRHSPTSISMVQTAEPVALLGSTSTRYVLTQN